MPSFLELSVASRLSDIKLTRMVYFRGLLGYFKILAGSNIAGIEQKISWATPATFTETNFKCFSDGSNCRVTHHENPSASIDRVKKRLRNLDSVTSQ